MTGIPTPDRVFGIFWFKFMFSRPLCQYQIPVYLQGTVCTLRKTRKARVPSWELSGVKCRERGLSLPAIDSESFGVSLMDVLCPTEVISIPGSWVMLGTPPHHGDSQVHLQSQSCCLWEAQAPQQGLLGYRPGRSSNVTGRQTPATHAPSPGCRVWRVE